MVGRLRRFVGGALAGCLGAAALIVGPAVSPALADDENLPVSSQITGAATLMSAGTAPSAVAVNGSSLYVTNLNGNSILSLAQSADGDTAPSTAIFGGNTQLSSPSGIAVSGTEVFVANNGSDTITVYNTADTGNAAPSRTITGVSAAWGVAVDDQFLYVASWPTFGAGAVRVFDKSASGAATPLHTVTTGVDKPAAIAVDGSTMYVANHGNASIAALDMASNYAVLRTITAAGNNGLNYLYGIAAAGGKVYVTNAEGALGFGPYTVAVFDSVASGGATPLRKIVGASTALGLPKGIAFDVDEAEDPDRHMIYVANAEGYVTSYAVGVPEVPTLTAAVGGLDEIELTVAPAGSGDSAITGYQYSTDAGATFVDAPAHTLTSPDTFAIATQSTAGNPALVAGTSYAIKVRAVNSNGASAASGSQSASSYSAPAAPVITAVTGGSGQLTVAGTQGSTGGSAISGYEYSTEGESGPWLAAGASLPLALTQRSDASAFSPGGTYSVRIRATNSAPMPQTSASSAPVDGTTFGAGALTFSSGAFDAVTYGASTIREVAVTNSGQLPAIPSSFAVAGSGVTALSGSTCAVGTPIAPAASCTYRVRWQPSAAGELTGASLTITYPDGAQASSSLALTGTASQASQTVSFSTPVSMRVVGGATYTPGATGGASGNPVVFTISSGSSNTCSIDSGVVSFIGVGTCTVQANQAGNANYSAAAQIVQNLPVAQGTQVITFPTPADTAINQGPVPLAAVASSALAIAYTSSTPDICEVAGSAVSLLSMGDCTVDADQAGDANWSPAATVTRTFAVTEAAVIPEPAPGPGTPQRAISGCVTTGKTAALPRRGTKRLMKAGCETTAGKAIAVRVSRVALRDLSARGDQRPYSLYCLVKSGKRSVVAKTSAAGYGTGMRSCAKGELRIRTHGSGARMTIQWYAPAVDGFAAFTSTKRFRS